MVRQIIGAVALFVFACAIGLSARTALQQAGGSLLGELSIADAAAKDGVFDSLWDGYPVIPGERRIFKAASPERKAAFVKALGMFARTYTSSALFRERYAEYWQANRPKPPEPPSSQADRDAEAARGMREMEENLKNMPPEMRKEMEAVVKQLKEQQEAMRKDAKMQAMIAQGAKMQQEAEARDYAERLKTYEAEHPKNPDALVAKRLREFLDLSATVDFNAGLVKSGEKMKFEKTEYENQSAEWKLCYRAGREATAAARAFAQEWLKELVGK